MPTTLSRKALPSVAFGLAAFLAASTASAVAPHRSARFLSSANGHASIAFDTQTSRVTDFLEHPYRYPAAGSESRDFAFDSYPGVRVGTAGSWLPASTPITTEYVPGTGIVHVVRAIAGVTIDEYHFAPIGLAENASFMIVKATRTTGAAVPVDAFGLFNFHLGAGSPQPSADGEQIAYNASRDAFYEFGASGVAFGYASLGTSTHHASSPANPYATVMAAGDLGDNAGTTGATNDAVAGFQTSLGTLAPGASAYAGWFTVLAKDALAQDAVDRVRTFVAGRTAEKLFTDEVAAWGAWVTAPPAGATPLEAALARQAQAIVRMAQVTEAGKPAGQILASLAPGKWNIAWVRDMAYATVALARTGHAAEAKAALAFQMGATANLYGQYVGSPYQISVVRYYGNGTEETDSDANGPNIEFDGFGLFLWALDEYVRATNDTATLAAWWPVVSTKIADVLVKLQESSGLIAPDSSIWEVHWNGKQRHFAYTTITAANGLCAAARLADKLGSGSVATGYRTAGAKARDAILTSLRAPDGTIAQSTEGLAGGNGWLDAAAVEAINFGLVHPDRRTAKATMHSIQRGLVPPSGRGFMRNDLGAWYDSQEWIFVDLRSNRPFALAGEQATATATLAWNVEQAAENFQQLSELHERTTGDYAGENPMVGFGAGAYLLALGDRGTKPAPTCDAFADEPAEPGADGGTVDGGVGPGPGPGGDAGADGGNAANGDVGSPASSCSCTTAGAPSSQMALGIGGTVLMLAAIGRRRKRS